MKKIFLIYSFLVLILCCNFNLSAQDNYLSNNIISHPEGGGMWAVSQAYFSGRQYIFWKTGHTLSKNSVEYAKWWIDSTGTLNNPAWIQSPLDVNTTDQVSIDAIIHDDFLYIFSLKKITSTKFRVVMNYVKYIKPDGKEEWASPNGFELQLDNGQFIESNDNFLKVCSTSKGLVLFYLLDSKIYFASIESMTADGKNLKLLCNDFLADKLFHSYSSIQPYREKNFAPRTFEAQVVTLQGTEVVFFGFINSDNFLKLGAVSVEVLFSKGASYNNSFNLTTIEDLSNKPRAVCFGIGSMDGQPKAFGTPLNIIVALQKDMDRDWPLKILALDLDNAKISPSRNFDIGKIQRFEDFCLAPYFKIDITNKKRLNQEQWLVIGSSFYNGRTDWSAVRLVRYKSDYLIEVSSKLGVPDIKNHPFYNIVGVVEGPPPFTQNEGSQGSSYFEYGENNIQTLKNETTWGLSTVATVGGVSKLGGAQFSFSLGVKQSSETSTTTKITSNIKLFSTKTDTLGRILAIVPTVNRKEYKVFRNDGTEKNEILTVFSVTDAAFRTIPFHMINDSGVTMTPTDFKTYLYNNKPSSYAAEDFFLMKGHTINSGGESQTVNLITSDSKSISKQGTIGFSFKIGVKDIFTGTTNGEFSSKTSTITSVDKAFGYNIVSPAFPRPLAQYPKDVKSFDFTAYFLKPNPKGYWVPENYAGPSPWLITWKVNRIQYNDGTELLGNSNVSNPGPDEDKSNSELKLPIIPEKISLFQNYPNPFNPSTIISYELPINNFVTLKIYDVIGREIETLVNKEQPSGRNSVEWNATKYPSGIYYYEIKAGDYRSIKKMIYIK